MMRALFAKGLLAGMMLYFFGADMAAAQDCGAEVCIPPDPPPEWISGPGHSSTGDYVISWQGEVHIWPPYILEESINGGNWVAREVYNNHYAFTGKPSGTYAYRVSICIASCGWTTATHVV